MNTKQLNAVPHIKKYYDWGFSFFHTKSTKKKVATNWTHYQTHKPTEQEIRSWLTIPYQNYAVVCGEISNILVIDLDSYKGEENPHHNEYLKYETFTVKTPSGGHHIYFQYSPLLPQIKHQGKGFLKNIDLQSNNSLIFLPPSDFGKGEYFVVKDKPIAPLPEELLHKILDQLNKDSETKDETYIPPKLNPKLKDSMRPGDVLNRLATWEQLLIPLGWQKKYNHNGTTYWVRPDKNINEGISASTNYNNYDLFFCFTTHFPELSQKKGYSKFNFYATMYHGGDYKKSAKHLVDNNFSI